MHFGKKGKLTPRCGGPSVILKRSVLVVCWLELTEELSSVHDTFHVSTLKEYLADASLHVPLNVIKNFRTLRLSRNLW